MARCTTSSLTRPNWSPPCTRKSNRTSRCGSASSSPPPRRPTPVAVLRLGAEAWLDACAKREVQQIVLLDGPSVLGWHRWRAIGMRYGLGQVEGLLTHAIAVGRIPEQPVNALAHLLAGALDEAALYIARADDPAAARSDMSFVIARLIRQLADD